MPPRNRRERRAGRRSGWGGLPPPRIGGRSDSQVKGPPESRARPSTRFAVTAGAVCAVDGSFPNSAAAFSMTLRPIEILLCMRSTDRRGMYRPPGWPRFIYRVRQIRPSAETSHLGSKRSKQSRPDASRDRCLVERWGDQFAVSPILTKVALEQLGRGRVVHGYGDLFILFHRAAIDIDRSHQGHRSIDEQRLDVHHRRLVAPNPRPVIYQFGEMRLRNDVTDPLVGVGTR